MRRLVAITAFALSLAAPLWAQRGGGHGGGGGGRGGGFSGHGGGFSGGHIASGGGHIGGGHFSSGIHAGPVARNFSHAPLAAQRNFSHGPFLHDGFRQDRFRGYGFRNYRFRNSCYGYGCWGGYAYGYPWYPWWYGSPYYDPWWWWDSDSSYDNSYEQNLANANAMNEQNLEEQRMLRQEEADGDQDLYAGSVPAPRPQSSAEKQGAAVIPATVLVFCDKHTREIQNYAILGQTLWNFAPQRTEKISLADLDLNATIKANEDRGVSFRVPAAGQTQ
jgi:hypothetical protein